MIKDTPTDNIRTNDIALINNQTISMTLTIHKFVRNRTN